MTECDVIREKLPGAAIQICLFHALRTFWREVTTEKLGICSDERLVCLEILQKMAYAAGEDAYTRTAGPASPADQTSTSIGVFRRQQAWYPRSVGGRAETVSVREAS